MHLLIERQGIAAAGKLRMETDNSLIELQPACVVLNHDMFAEPIRAGLAFQAQPHRRMAHCTATRGFLRYLMWLPPLQATQGTKIMLERLLVYYMHPSTSLSLRFLTREAAALSSQYPDESGRRMARWHQSEAQSKNRHRACARNAAKWRTHLCPSMRLPSAWPHWGGSSASHVPLHTRAKLSCS